MFLHAEFCCPLFSNYDEAIFLIVLVLPALKKLINNSKTESITDILPVDTVLVHLYFV